MRASATGARCGSRTRTASVPCCEAMPRHDTKTQARVRIVRRTEQSSYPAIEGPRFDRSAERRFERGLLCVAGAWQNARRGVHPCTETGPFPSKSSPTSPAQAGFLTYGSNAVVSLPSVSRKWLFAAANGDNDSPTTVAWAVGDLHPIPFYPARRAPEPNTARSIASDFDLPLPAHREVTVRG